MIVRERERDTSFRSSKFKIRMKKNERVKF